MGQGMDGQRRVRRVAIGPGGRARRTGLAVLGSGLALLAVAAGWPAAGQLPGRGSWVEPASVLECCGHDGTYAMTVEGFLPSKRIGAKAFEGMKAAEAEVWATDCPLAALQFQQHAGRKPMHPMSILARAYREDGFPTRVGAGDEGKDGEK